MRYGIEFGDTVLYLIVLQMLCLIYFILRIIQIRENKQIYMDVPSFQKIVAHYLNGILSCITGANFDHSSTVNKSVCSRALAGSVQFV
jgi:hypothetical protein